MKDKQPSKRFYTNFMAYDKEHIKRTTLHVNYKVFREFVYEAHMNGLSASEVLRRYMREYTKESIIRREKDHKKLKESIEQDG